MAVTVDCRIAPSAAGQLHSAAGMVGRHKGNLKFCNGRLMGEKLKFTHFHHTSRSKNVKSRVCMTLTTNVAGEAKVSS